MNASALSGIETAMAGIILAIGSLVIVLAAFALERFVVLPIMRWLGVLQ